MNNKPLFSIIIPLYNAETTIIKCVSSVINQTCKNFELILINDGSTDNSSSVIESIQSEYKNEIILKSIVQKNSGAGSARNNGIVQAVGDYIVFLDSDDYLDSGFLEETKKIIEEDNAELIFVDIVRERNDGTVIRYERMSLYNNLEKDHFIRCQLTGKIPWGGVRKVIKKSIIVENNIHFATSIKVGEECLYSYRVLSYSNHFSFQSKALYHYVDNGSSLTSHDSVSNSLDVYEYIKSSFERGAIDIKYKDTIKALALTTMVVITNVLSQRLSLLKACNEASRIYKMYKNDFLGHIDLYALDNRVKFFYPCIRIGFFFPIVLAGKLFKLIRGRKK